MSQSYQTLNVICIYIMEEQIVQPPSHPKGPTPITANRILNSSSSMDIHKMQLLFVCSHTEARKSFLRGSSYKLAKFIPGSTISRLLSSVSRDVFRFCKAEWIHNNSGIFVQLDSTLRTPVLT